MLRNKSKQDTTEFKNFTTKNQIINKIIKTKYIFDNNCPSTTSNNLYYYFKRNVELNKYATNSQDYQHNTEK